MESTEKQHRTRKRRLSSTETDNGSATISSEYRDPKVEARLSDVRERSRIDVRLRLLSYATLRPTLRRRWLMSTSLSQLTLFHFMTSAHFLQNASTAQRSSSPVSVCHTHTAACVMQSLVSVAATAKKPYSVYYVVQYRRSQAFCRQRRSHPPSKAATAGDVGTENCETDGWPWTRTAST